MVSSELTRIWIASDGKKFFKEQDAIEYDKLNNMEDEWF